MIDVARLRTAFPSLKWQTDYSLAAQTYFKIGGPAQVYVEIDSVDVLSAVVAYCNQAHFRLTMLGGASNVIVADEGIEGIVIHLTNDKVEPMSDETNKVIGLRAGAGTKMSLLVAQMTKLNLTGLEYFLGVPGTLGGAIYNNAHYLSHLISEHVSRVLVIKRSTGEKMWLTHKECEFAYDHSRFQTSHEIIAEVEFALSTGDSETSRALIREATVYRAATQPLGQPSSGCIFQNVPNSDHLRQLFPQFADRTHVPGGFIIEQAGLKGAQVGDVEVSHKHAAFMINKGHGTSADLQTLITQVKSSVKAKFGVELTEEVFFLH